MATKVGINGFGRIGRQVLKAIRDRHPEQLAVVDAVTLVGLAILIRGTIGVLEQTYEGGNLPDQIRVLETFTLWFIVLGIMANSTIRLGLYLWVRSRAYLQQAEGWDVEQLEE